MVAITVLLGATIAAFVLGATAPQSLSPQVEWHFAYNASGETLTIAHAGGDPVDGDAVRVAGISSGEEPRLSEEGPSTWTAGSEATFDVDPTVEDPTVRLIFEGDGGHSSLLTEWPLPVG